MYFMLKFYFYEFLWIFFLCKKAGGGWFSYIFCFFSRTTWQIFMKLGRYEVLMVPYKCCCFSSRSVNRWRHHRQKYVPEGTLPWQTFSSEPKHVSTNLKHLFDLERCLKKCCYFWFHSGIKFLTRFWRLFGFCQKCTFLHYFFR